MNRPFLGLIAIGLIAVIFSSACSPQAAGTQVDAEATAVAQALSLLLTQTAGAASPMPRPLAATLSPTPTITPIPEATPTPAHGYPITLNFAGCWFGPGPTYVSESNISKGIRVEVLGIGNVPGWYIIRNPYFHRPCWMQAANLKFDPGANSSNFPVMTPGP
jgi:hypothetical protein